MVPRPFRVAQTRRDTRDTFTLELEPADGVPLAFAAGQFTMLPAFGVGEVPISISGDPTRADAPRAHHPQRRRRDPHARRRRSPGRSSGSAGRTARAGASPTAKGGDVVIVAGGIGLAPLRPAILELIAQRDQYHRVVLLYGARTPEDILFGNELRQWEERHGIDVQVTVDNGPHDWKGRVGFVTQLVTRAGFDPHRDARARLRARGDDARRRRRPCATAASPRSASGCRWSAT